MADRQILLVDDDNIDDQYEMHDGTESEFSDALLKDAEATYKPRFLSRRFRWLPTLSLCCPSLPQHGPLRYAVYLLPSFLHPADINTSEPKTLRRTAALDGLRGMAAFFVLNFHYFGTFTNTNSGYVVGNPYYATFWNLPMIKFFSSGTSMVHIFFAISGYILSLRSLQHMRKQNVEGVVKTLSSSTFRRAFRLFGPTSISMFIEMFAIQLGWFENSRANLPLVPWENAYFPPRYATLLEKFAKLRLTIWGMADPFSWGEYHSKEFDVNLWTIPIEFRCSIALFVIILAICRIYRPWIRRSVVMLLIATFISYQRWDLVLFLGGMMLADYDVWSDALDDSGKKSRTHQLFWGIIALLGVYFCSSPPGAPDIALGFGWITQVGIWVYPAYAFHFAETIGAICLVAAAMHSIPTRRILESRLVQYLGRISYMLYVVHGPLIRLWALTIVPWIWRVIAKEAPRDSTPYGIGYAIGYFFYVPVSFWFADIYTRTIDDKCVDAARWLEEKCISTG